MDVVILPSLEVGPENIPERPYVVQRLSGEIIPVAAGAAVFEFLPFFESAESLVDDSSDTPEMVGLALIDHSCRVGRMAQLIAADFWPNRPEMADLALTAGLMHDIGKIPLAKERPSLINCHKPFGPEEMRLMASHAGKGFAILSSSELPTTRLAAVVARLHHSIRPEARILDIPGLSDLLGETQRDLALQLRDIETLILIVAVCDIYDAIQNRPYIDTDLRPDYVNYARFSKSMGKLIQPPKGSDFAIHDGIFFRVTGILQRIVATEGMPADKG